MKRVCNVDGKWCLPDYSSAERTPLVRLNSKKQFVSTNQVKWTGHCRKCGFFMEWMVGKSEPAEKPEKKGQAK